MNKCNKCNICREKCTLKRSCENCTCFACKKCIEEWFKTSNTCPQCRGILSWFDVNYKSQEELISLRTMLRTSPMFISQSLSSRLTTRSRLGSILGTPHPNLRN